MAWKGMLEEKILVGGRNLGSRAFDLRKKGGWRYRWGNEYTSVWDHSGTLGQDLRDLLGGGKRWCCFWWEVGSDFFDSLEISSQMTPIFPICFA